MAKNGDFSWPPAGTSAGHNRGLFHGHGHTVKGTMSVRFRSNCEQSQNKSGFGFGFLVRTSPLAPAASRGVPVAGTVGQFDITEGG